MATQNAGHAPLHFSITSPFQAVRFIEVPEELVEYITSVSTSTSTGTSTTQPRLKFKSAPQVSSSTTTSVPGYASKEGVLHLCTDDKAWAVKQVSTSNSVYLIQPSIPLVQDEDGDGEGEGEGDVEMRDALEFVSAGAVSAIAQVGNFLELHPVKIDEDAVERSILELVPVYHPPRDDEDVDLDFQAVNEAKTAMVLDRAVNDVAVPDEVVRRVCRKLGVVEIKDGRDEVRCMIPSTRVALDVWSEIVRGCTIESVKLDGEVSLVGVLNVLHGEVEEAVAEALLGAGGIFDQFGLFEDQERRLKTEQTCQFVAGLLLSSERDMSMDDSTFMSKWTDLVPASFVKYCNVEALTSSATALFAVKADQDGRNIICWTGPTFAKGVVLVTALAATPVSAGVASIVTDEGSSKASTTSSAAADKKRKWHEKFGAQRNVKR